MFFTQQLQGLKDPDAPFFKRYFYLLEVSSHARCVPAGAVDELAAVVASSGGIFNFFFNFQIILAVVIFFVCSYFSEYPL